MILLAVQSLKKALSEGFLYEGIISPVCNVPLVHEFETLCKIYQTSSTAYAE
jgi:hypothetical protein